MRCTFVWAVSNYWLFCENGTDDFLNDWQVYKCLSCDYLFGNLSDLKRHLKIRHHVQVLGIPGIENISEVEASSVLLFVCVCLCVCVCVCVFVLVLLCDFVCVCVCWGVGVGEFNALYYFFWLLWWQLLMFLCMNIIIIHSFSYLCLSLLSFTHTHTCMHARIPMYTHIWSPGYRISGDQNKLLRKVSS